MKNPFNYPTNAHRRRHSPSGYSDYTSYKPWLRDEFRFRCVYCLNFESWNSDGHLYFGVDHFIPICEEYSLECEYSNLIYSCNRCNSAKGKTLIPHELHPEITPLGSHLQVLSNGEVISIEEGGIGKFWIQLLHLNSEHLIALRKKMSQALNLVANPQDNDPKTKFIRRLFEYPDDMPELAKLRPTENIYPQSHQTAYRYRNSCSDYLT